MSDLCSLNLIKSKRYLAGIIEAYEATSGKGGLVLFRRKDERTRVGRIRVDQVREEGRDRCNDRHVCFYYYYNGERVISVDTRMEN